MLNDVRKRKYGQGWEVVDKNGNTVCFTAGRHGAEDIAAKRNKRLK